MVYLRMSHRTPFTIRQYFGAVTKKIKKITQAITYDAKLTNNGNYMDNEDNNHTCFH